MKFFPVYLEAAVTVLMAILLEEELGFLAGALAQASLGGPAVIESREVTGNSRDLVNYSARFGFLLAEKKGGGGGVHTDPCRLVRQVKKS
jgi:hypothetical protein